MLKQQRILGALYGQVLGDAMGMPSELWPQSKVQQFFGWIDRFLDGPEENTAACYFSKAQFTDDTSMALAIADAIIEKNGQICANAIGQHILAWAQDFDAFNKNILGPTSKQALTDLSNGKSIASLENNGLTNGAAMRASPLGCLLPTKDIQNFIEQVTLASSPTHKSDVAVAGAVCVAWAVSKAIDGCSWQEIKLGISTIAQIAQMKKITTFSPSLAARLDMALDVVAHKKSPRAILIDIYDKVGAGTATIESVPAAFAIVELAQGDPNQCAVLSANLGGDTDTIGAMATAICGALTGIEGIRSDLKQQLDEANRCDLGYYSEKLNAFRQLREENVQRSH
ncbi:ADP-ribosylglycohydrolase family protein [Gammaproteobacteria bacterium ESL0073]|nr:ADP-ribosylglycohydrolase family protein [Gammaproteobacteria bacterium ESL0073]